MPRQAHRQRESHPGKDPTREFQHDVAGMATAVVLQRWSRPQPTIWKKPSCGASAVSWSRPAWPERETRNPCNRWSEGRRKSAATILAPVDRGRNTKSATARNRGLQVLSVSAGSAENSCGRAGGQRAQKRSNGSIGNVPKISTPLCRTPLIRGWLPCHPCSR